MKTISMAIGAASAALLIGSPSRQAEAEPANAPLTLATNGSTRYRVVTPDNPSPVDDYAVNALTNFLFQKTGAVFPVVTAAQCEEGGPRSPSAGRAAGPAAPGARNPRPARRGVAERRREVEGHLGDVEAHPSGPAIFVGMSEPARKLVGTDPLAELDDQQYVVRSVGTDILLYGKGMHGNLHAVMDFMENTLGRRWYSGRQVSETPPQWKNGLGQPFVTVERDLVVMPFTRQGGFSFAYRMPCYDWMFDFHLQSGMNMFLERRSSQNAFSLKVMPALCHTLFGYIPPSAQAQPATNVFGWLPKKDYFATNPEYFTLNKSGKRVAGQLCFSNPGLRGELTKNILEHIRLLKDQGAQRLVIDLSAMDDVGEFCYCPDCEVLKKKCQAVGGPFYDYLFELCPVVKAQHPDTLIHTLAYRLEQTQKPPVMPAGQVFPDNLIVQYANVHDHSDVDWNSPVNRPSYEDLLAWRKLTPRLWTWYYPFNGMIDRMVTDIRLMKKAGAEGVFLEFGDNSAINFSELQIYVYNKLLQDVDRDVPELIRDFTDHQYGPAAPLARTYLRDMEEAWKRSSTNTSFGAGAGMSRKLTGVTPATIRRWQEAFDRMDGLTAADPRLQQNVRRLRRGLDFRTLAEWNELTRALPDYFSDYLVVKERLGALPRWYIDYVNDLEMMIKMGGVEKPLPPPFDGIDKALVRRFVPPRVSYVPAEKVEDPDAAFGYASVVYGPNKPFTFGFYQNDTQTHGVRHTVNTNEISMGSYRVYPLGEIQVTPDCIVWFSSSWAQQLQLGERLYSPPAPDNDNRYDVHVSLKFVDKPIGRMDTNAPYSVLCDQIIFVKKPVR